MTTNNELEERLVNKKKNYAKEEYTQVIDNLCFNNKNKNPDIIKEHAIEYLAGFYAAKDIKDRTLRKINPETRRKYFAKISTDNLLKKINGHKTIITKDFQKINFNGSDFKTNMKIIEEYSKNIQRNNANIDDITRTYFQNLDEYLYNELNETLTQNDIKKTIRKQKNGTDNEEERQKFFFKKTKYEDIIGNERAKKDIKTSIQKLFLYNQENKKNPALEKNKFKQNYLLVGEPGNGKGMLNAYAATIGEELEEKLQKKLNVISLDPASKYQYGPLKKIQKCFREINESNELYLVLIDEIDSNFSARDNTKTQDYTKQIVTELLKFTNSPIDYVNKGNYILIASTNNTQDIDKALINRFNKNTYLCEGPKTKDEKIKLIQKLITNNVPKEKINIHEWNNIGNIAQKENLSGREITGCIENVLEYNSNNEFTQELYTQDYTTQLKFFEEYKTITTKTILEELENTIKNRERKSYL